MHGGFGGEQIYGRPGEAIAVPHTVVARGLQERVHFMRVHSGRVHSRVKMGALVCARKHSRLLPETNSFGVRVYSEMMHSGVLPSNKK